MTSEPPVNKGVLSDKEGAGFPGCRITVDGETTDRPFVIMPFVQRYLDNIPKKARVCFQTKEGKIVKIWEDKEPANKTDNGCHVHEPVTPQGDKDCTSPKTPESNPLTPDTRSSPKKISGEIMAIDAVKRTLALRSLDEKNYEITTLFIWRENKDLDQTAQKQKVGWYISVTYEAQGEVNRAMDMHYAERPANFPRNNQKGKGGYGGRPYVPKNDKIVVYQCVYKECSADVRAILPIVDFRENVDWEAFETTYNKIKDIALKRALKDGEALCKAGGA